MRLVLEVGPQQVLELRLVEHVRPRVPVPSFVSGAVEHGEDSVVPVDQLQAAGGTRDGGELLGDAHSGDDAVDLVVEVHGPRLGVDTLPAVQDEAVDAVLPEQGGGGEPDRAGADDDHRDGIGAGALGTAHRRPPNTRMRKARVVRPRTTAGSQLARAVAAAEVGDHCSAEQQQQSRRGQCTDHRHQRPDQQAEDTEDLEDSDPPVRRDTEADVCGPGAHGGHGSEFRGAGRREGDDEDAGEDGGCVHDSSL